MPVSAASRLRVADGALLLAGSVRSTPIRTKPEGLSPVDKAKPFDLRVGDRTSGAV
jgi:hypothetical protein